MKHIIARITLISAVSVAVGCQQPRQAPKPDNSVAAKREKAAIETREAERASQEADKAARDADKANKEAAQATSEYAYARKAELVARIKADLVVIEAELDRLSAKVDRTTGETKAEAKARLETVREKWARANKELERAEGATESTWNDVKDGIKSSYEDVKGAFDQTRQWLSDKIEP